MEHFDAKQEFLNLSLMLTIILIVILQVETYLCQRPGGDITHPWLLRSWGGDKPPQILSLNGCWR